MLKAKHRRQLLALALLAVCLVARAEVASDDARSNAAMRLFLNVCAVNLGDEQMAKEWVTEHQLHPFAPAFAEEVLQGKPGEVWSASNPIGDFLIVIQSPRQCSVWARKANARLSGEQFQKYVTGVERPGLSVKLQSDRKVEGKDGRYRLIAYTIARENAGSGVLLEAITSDSPTAQVQVRLKIAQVKLAD